MPFQRVHQAKTPVPQERRGLRVIIADYATLNYTPFRTATVKAQKCGWQDLCGTLN